MRIELLYFDDCPNWKTADDRLQTVAAARGLRVEHRLVTTPEEAEATRVYQTPEGPAGSPTVEQLEGALDG